MREDKIAAILNDSAVRDWVKVQYRLALNRDMLDALEDAGLLADMLQMRWDAQEKKSECVL